MRSMLIDSHCHLASHRFDGSEVVELLDAARAAGVGRLVTLATSLDDLQANLVLANDGFVHAGVGIHPCDVHHAPDDALEQLAAVVSDPRVCVVGETGLDYYHPAPDGWDEARFRDRQRDWLVRHFELAARAKLNVVIHTRDRSGCDSFEDALSIYQDFSKQVRAVFHCFIGSWDHAQRVIEMGGLVSFGGVLTFKNARDVCETAVSCPPGSFMLETDSPYLAPEPQRGKRNQPAYVRHVAEFLASRRGETFEDLIQHTGVAAEAFFRFRGGD